VTECLVNLKSYVLVLLKQVLEILTPDDNEVHIRLGNDRGGSKLVLNKAHLAEQLSSAKSSDFLFRPAFLLEHPYFALFMHACPLPAAPNPDPALDANQVQPEVVPDPAVPELDPELQEPQVGLFPTDETGKPVFEQGQAFLVKVSDPKNIIASIRAKWGDQVIPCLPVQQGMHWYGLGAIHRELIPGEYTVVVSMETTDGRTASMNKIFTVIEVNWEEDTLRVAPKYANSSNGSGGQVGRDRKAFRKGYAQGNMGRYWSGPFERPLPGRVTSPFGTERVFNGVLKSVHSGVDLAGPTGEPVKATAAGRAIVVRSAFIEGKTVLIDHGGGFFTVYCHLSKTIAEEGSLVEKGEVIGLCGATGRVTGPHLHWGAKIHGTRVDALSLLELNPWLEEDN